MPAPRCQPWVATCHMTRFMLHTTLTYDMLYLPNDGYYNGEAMTTWSAIDVSGGQPLHYRCQQVISPIMNESHKERQYQISWLMCHMTRAGYEPQTVWVPLDALQLMVGQVDKTNRVGIEDLIKATLLENEEFSMFEYVDWLLNPGLMGLDGLNRQHLNRRLGESLIEALAQEAPCPALA
jgi:hypothetical protein